METAACLRRSGGGEEGDMETKRSQFNNDEDDSKNEYMLFKDDQLESVKAEMCRVRQENERLKAYLDNMTMDYQTLQKKFHNSARHEQVDQAPKKFTDQKILEHEEPEFVCLSLGRSSPGEVKVDDYYKEKSTSPKKVKAGAATVINLREKENGLVKLGLNCKFDEGSFSEPNPSIENNSREEVVGETCSSKTSLKTMRSTVDDEVLVQQNPAKKARVSVRVRCAAPTMNDGCQWRKYGQKIAKGNPCPRAYYRCTVAPSCPVRKQVQRCSQDMSILISTYEGTHSHPLPLSATAMASTTSAAAVMLLSGSSSSTSDPGPSPSATAIAAQQLHGLNFYLSKPNPSFYFPNSSNLSSPSCPTITLDLVNTPSSSRFNRLSTTTNYTPKYQNSSTSNLNFSSTTFESNTAPISWSYGNSSHQSPYNQIMTSQNFGSRHPQENVYHTIMQKNNGARVDPTQTFQPHSIEAATKAITSDPSFQSALAVAINSIIGTNHNASHRVKSEQQPSSDKKSPQLPMSSSRSNSSTSPGDSNR